MKKESKNIKILIKDDEHKIALFPKEETKDEKKDVNKEDKDNNKDCKNNNNNSMSNPFSVLINKENEPKEKDQNDNQKSLFGNIFNNNQSLFGNVNNNNANNAKSLFSIPIKLSEKEKEESYNNIIDNKDKKETKEENNSGSVSLFGNTPLFSNNGGKSLFSNNNDKSNTENFTPLLFSNMEIILLKVYFLIIKLKIIRKILKKMEHYLEEMMTLKNRMKMINLKLNMSPSL